MPPWKQTLIAVATNAMTLVRGGSRSRPQRRQSHSRRRSGGEACGAPVSPPALREARESPPFMAGIPVKKARLEADGAVTPSLRNLHNKTLW